MRKLLGAVATGRYRYHKRTAIYGRWNGNFLEAEDKEKLMHFYEDENGFKQFDVRETKCSDNDEIHKLVQLLKVM